MQILKRFLLCTTLATGICIAPITKTFADTNTELTANETSLTNSIEEEDDLFIQSTENELDMSDSEPLGSDNLMEQTEVNDEMVPQGTVGEDQQDVHRIPLGIVKQPTVTATPTPGITSVNKTWTNKTGINTLNSASTQTTNKTSKASQNSTESKKNNEAKVPKMYINVSESRRNMLMNTVKLGKKDKSYTGKTLKITGKNRELLEALVYGEAGGEGFIGQCLVAQAIRDTMIEENEKSVKKIIRMYQYAGKTCNGTSQEVKDAVKFIFDDGGYAVQHRIVFFYAPKICRSKFHEKQKFVIEWKGHRFFDNSAWIERDNKNEKTVKKQNKR
ncbi:MAG: hypothetical protein PUC65_02900 [Clostridiales bacterium]|nr:hypothetical protein [Clostridiales bacterium]